MGASLEIQKAMFTKLDGTAAVTTLLAVNANDALKKAIYDHVPQPAKPESAVAFPYVVLGEWDMEPADTDDALARETFVTVHTFSRYLGKAQLDNIMDAVKAALHDSTLTVSGEKFVFCFLDSSSAVVEPDGITRHGVQNFRLYTEGT